MGDQAIQIVTEVMFVNCDAFRWADLLSTQSAWWDASGAGGCLAGGTTGLGIIAYRLRCCGVRPVGLVHPTGAWGIQRRALDRVFSFLELRARGTMPGTVCGLLL